MDRRRFMAASGTALGTVLAGCSDRLESGGNSTSTTTSTTSTTTETASTPTTTAESQTYSVSMAPVGTVEFDAVPGTVALYFPGYADMVVALGHADAVASVGLPSRYHTGYYDDLEGVSIDKSSLTTLYDGGIGKETFYSVGADLHLLDPNWLLNNFKGWKQKDIDELVEQQAPFLGNVIFRRTDTWHDYRYYTMYDAFEKVAGVFQEFDRFQEFVSFHDNFVADVQSRLPGPDQRPNAALLFRAKDEPESFSPYRLSGKGTNKKQFHDLGITDAFAGTGIQGLSTSERGRIDYETLLEVDPDSILLRGHETKTAEEFQNTVVTYMKNHDLASELTAVQDEQVFRGGPIYEGPIQNLFLTERFARAYFPDTYTEAELFSRGELAAIVRGDS